MPRLPGRKSSRRSVPMGADLLVSSFIMVHESWLWRQPCVIQGCDHRMGPNPDDGAHWAVQWEECAQEAAAYIVRETNLDDPIGIACPCHVREILQRA